MADKMRRCWRGSGLGALCQVDAAPLLPQPPPPPPPPRPLSPQAAAAYAPPHAGCQRLFDLVTPRPDAPGAGKAKTGGAGAGAGTGGGTASRLRSAFYFALRDTLVAPDMNTAAAVAYRSDGRCVRGGRRGLAVPPAPSRRFLGCCAEGGLLTPAHSLSLPPPLRRAHMRHVTRA